MDNVKLNDALDEAHKGLREVSEQFEELRAKKTQLEGLVRSLQVVLGINYEAVMTLPKAFSLAEQEFGEGEGSAKFASLPLWRVARDLLVENNRPMSVPEMMNTLVLRGAHVQGDGIRVAMIRRPDIFAKVSYGRYGLVEWVAAQPSTAVEEQSEEESAVA